MAENMQTKGTRGIGNQGSFHYILHLTVSLQGLIEARMLQKPKLMLSKNQEMHLPSGGECLPLSRDLQKGLAWQVANGESININSVLWLPKRNDREDEE